MRSRTCKAMVLLACGAALSFHQPTLAQCQPEWLGVSGFGSPVAISGQAVDASTVWFDPVLKRNVLVIAGRFTSINGGTFNHIATWDGSTLRPLGTGLSGTFPLVGSMVSHNGDLIVTGTFTSAGGVAVSNVARWNGTSWSAMPGLAGPGWALLVSGGNQLYVGGEFTNAGGTANTANFARWNGAGWSSVSTGVNGRVLTMENWNGRVVVGGEFTQAGGAGGVAAPRIAAWSETSQLWSALGTGIPNGSVKALRARSEDGALYVGGSFTTAGGQATGSLARWNGVNWSSVGGNFAGRVDALATYRGKLYITGLYPGINNSPSLATWDGSAYATPGTGGLGTSGSGFTMSVYNDWLVLGGAFGSAGGLFNQHIARWNNTEWSGLTPSLSGPVNALANIGGALRAGGDFQFQIDSSTRANYVTGTVDGVNFGQIATLPNAVNGTNGPVRAIGTFGTSPLVPATLVLGGLFSQAGGSPVSNITGFTLSGWNAYAGGFNGAVDAVAQFNNRLFATGPFTAAGSTPIGGIAQLVSGAWQPVGGGLTGGSGRAMAIYAGRLYVGGDFATPGPNLASWDGTGWSTLPTSITGPVNALAVYNNTLIIAGRFPSPSPFKWVAAWNGTTLTPMDAGLSTQNPPVGLYLPGALAVHNGELYMGLEQGETAAQTQLLYKWNGSAWAPVPGSFAGGTPQGPAFTTQIRALVSQGGALWAGGNFTNVDGHAVPYLTRLACACYANCDNSSVPPVLNPNDFSCFLNAYRNALTLPPDQQVLSYANCDQSNVPPVLNSLDFQCYLSKYAAGCP